MSNGNYENKILDAIQKIVDNAITKAHYDKTIKGIISKCSDAEIGKYTVKYQDSSLIAYSADVNTSYSIGEMVYVLIPGNDMTQAKTIIGSVDKLGTNYLNVVDTTSQYSVIGNNVVSNNGNEIGLCSYKPGGDTIVLYNKEHSGDALINLDITAANTYLKQSKYMLCGASFKTNLDAIQQYKGDYGIAFDLDFIDNNSGEAVVRTYLVNVNEMKGNPYNYLTPTEQLIAFDIDGENFQGINKISFYSYNFPVEDEDITIKDLFVSNVVLEGAEKLTEEELLGNSLILVTPEGIYFDDNDSANSSRSIAAQVKIDNNLLDANSSRLVYYWFKENNKISSTSDSYNRYGGIGWECLNEYNIITEEGITLKEWLPANSIYTTNKVNNSAKQNTYKCVAVYNNSVILSKEITLYNYSSAFDITITSDSGTYFSYDVGNPTLTCYVNGTEPEDTSSVKWTYSWAVRDNNNNYNLLEETETDNEEYNDAVTAYEELRASLQDGTTVLTEAIQEQLATLAAKIKSYDSVMRVEKNNIYKIKLNTITNFSTYTCFVYRNNAFVGKANITITNDLTSNRNSYNLVINNGNQVFKYNENGIAPTSKSLTDPQELYPLSFTLFDDSGKEIDNNAIKAKDVEWTVPTSNSLITISASHGNPSSRDTINETATYTNYKELYFTIANIFNANKDRNTIQLRVKYKDRIVVAKTDLIFIKEGEVGTNGTDFVCRIIPNAIDEKIPKYPTLVYNKNASVSDTNPTLNYTPAGTGLWLKAELWHDGVKIFDGITTNNSTENKQVKVEWEILKNKYKPNINDVSNLIVNKSTGLFNFNNLAAVSDTQLKANPANIVKCTLTYDGIEYYATIPITLVTVNNTSSKQYRAEVVENNGFRYAMYTTDGAKPIYDSASPFALKIYEIENNIEKDITNTILTDYVVNYSWSVKGLTYGSTQWNVEQNLIEKTLYSETLKRNERRFIPIDTCNGLAVNNALYCSITRNNTELMNIHIPIHLYLNKYGNSALNGWDGNHIEINEDGGFILAPQIGAGKKNADNSFTGVFMGSVKEAGQTKEEFGLYGYNAGERTIALNAEDGSARFGKSGMGQIVLDPTDNTATLKSGNYVAPVLDDSGNIVTAGQGLEIDLTDPHITFGSGKFRVDKDGNVYAQGFATIADLTAGNIDIPGADNFQVEYATDSVQIETDANLDPLETTVTKTISLKCLYKKQYTSDYSLNLIDSNGNIITHNGSTDGIGISISKSGNIATISFTARKDRQIAYATNSYLFRFTYTPKGDIIDKYFNVNLVIQGKDGERGATGPVGPAGKDGTSVTVKGTYASLADLKAAAAAQTITPVMGDGYIIDNDLYVFTNGAGGGGSQDGDWTDVGQFKGEDAKNCVVTSSAQVFKSTDGGVNYSPANITLTPYLWAVDFDKWQYIINNGTPVDLTGTLPTGISINSNTHVLTISKTCQLFNNSSAITFKCLTNDNNVYDTVTIIRVSDGINGEDGSDGESAYSVILTNEAQTIAGDNTKAIATSFSTGVIGYLGTTQKATTIGNFTVPTGITKTINNNGTINTTITFNVTNQLTTKNGQITIPVTIEGKTFNKVLSYSLALAGTNGVGINSVTNYYAVSSNNTTAPTSWSTSLDNVKMTNELRYLWNYESVNYSNNTSKATDPAVIGVYGDTGLSSTDGMPTIPQLTRWTFDKVSEKMIGSDSISCYPENSNSNYDFVRVLGTLQSKYSAAIFNGTQAIKTDSTIYDFNKSFTISFWLNPANVNTTQTILQNRKTDGNGLSVFLINNQIRFDCGGGQDTFSKAFVANTNYHIVLTYNYSNGQKKMYINGKLEQTKTITHSNQEFTNYLWMGISSTNGTSFSGNVLKAKIDDLRIYDYVLDLDNVGFLYRSQGQEASNGSDGRGLSEVVEYYLVIDKNSGITKNSSGWTTTIQKVTAINKYLWNYERLNYTDGSWSETDPVIIGTYGDKGDKGDPGANAINVILTNEAQVIAGSTTSAIAKDYTTDILGYVGSTQSNTKVGTISGLPTGMTAAITNNDSTSTKVTFTVTTSMTSKSGQVTIPVTISGQTINKTFSYALSLTGQQGGTGTAASLVDISASSQVFKSTDGGLTFAPNTITLTPRFQTVSYSKWQYSTNGGSSWTDVSSGSHGITLSGSVLTLAKGSDLFSDSVTTITFKCISSNSSIFDTMTIVRVYDVTNLVIGGRNLLLQTNQGVTNWGFNIGNKYKAPTTEEIKWLNQRALKVTSNGINDNYTSTWKLIYYNDKNIYKILKPSSTYTLSFDSTNKHTGIAISEGNGSNNIIQNYIFSFEEKVDENGEQYYHLKYIFNTKSTFERTNQYIYISSNMDYLDTAGRIVKYANIKLEEGNCSTDWTPAPEDLLQELESSISTINNDLEDIQDQIDGQVITWFYSGVPTKSNAPASSWTTNAQKDAHIGDYYYNTANGDAYRYSARDTWTKVSSAVAAALTAGTNAQITADKKRQIFYGSSTPTGTFDEGDLWSNGSDLKVYHNSSWILATDYTNFKLSDIQLGGRNLVLNSNFDNNMDKWSNWGSPTTREIVTINNKKWLHCITTSSSYQGLSQNRYNLLKTADLKPNTKYTLSFTMYGKEAYTGSIWGIHWKNEPETTGIISQIASGNVNITTTPKRYSWTVTTPDNVHNFNLMVGKWTGTITPEFWITDIKFEESNIVSNWTPAPEDSITYVDNLVADLQTQVDGKIQTYSQTTDPSSGWSTDEKTKHTGDLWYNSSTKVTKRWSGSAWTEIGNAEAEAAATLASKKAQIFTGTPTIPYYKGDLWITALNKTGVVKTCQTTRTTGSYTASDWVEGLKYTDDTLATTANNTANTANNKIDNLKVGGTNYVLESDVENRTKSPTSYPAAVYPLATDKNGNSYIKAGEKYTWSVTGTFTDAALIDVYFGGGQYGTNWQSVPGDGTYTISHTFTANANHAAQKFIQVYVRDANDGRPGTAVSVISKVQLEIGNQPSDWNLAPEDITSDIGKGVASAAIQYAVNDSNINPPTDEDIWNENTPSTSETNKYIWMRTITTYINGEKYTSTPICISYYERKLIRTSIEYAASEDSTTAPSTGWNENKPDDTSKYIWTREVNYYSSAPLIEWSTPSCDTLIKTLQNNLINEANKIKQGFTESGAIRIFDNKIYIVDNPVISEAKQAIMIGKNGIAFARNPNNQPLGWIWDDKDHTTGHFTNEDNWTSTWTIAGDFNAQNVAVKNLTANDIQDGTLSLGKSANTPGKLEVYTTNGQIATVTVDGDGIVVKDGNTIKAKLLKTGGLIVYDKAGAKAYGSTSDETSFEANTIVVQKEIDFGANIKGLIMEASVSGVTHKGIGFIKM